MVGCEPEGPSGGWSGFGKGSRVSEVAGNGPLATRTVASSGLSKNYSLVDLVAERYAVWELAG